MAVVTVATTKGGVGKSTTVSNLAVIANQMGASVLVLDCDPQRHSCAMISKYLDQMSSLRPDVLSDRRPLVVIDDSTQENLLARIEEGGRTYDLVLVDCQGSANQMMLFAMSEADLVIVPVQASQLDISGAELAWAQIASASRITRRSIAGRIFFTRTPAAIKPKVLSSARRQFEEMGYPTMQCEFVERTAFKEATYDGQFPTEFAPESHASGNVVSIYKEVLAILNASMSGENAA